MIGLSLKILQLSMVTLFTQIGGVFYTSNVLSRFPLFPLFHQFIFYNLLIVNSVGSAQCMDFQGTRVNYFRIQFSHTFSKLGTCFRNSWWYGLSLKIILLYMSIGMDVLCLSISPVSFDMQHQLIISSPLSSNCLLLELHHAIHIMRCHTFDLRMQCCFLI